MAVVPGRAIVYTRVSTDEQASSGLGAAAQRQSCETLAERLGVEIVAVFEDLGVSGAAPLESRPGLLAAVQAIEPDTLLLAARRDRIGRDVVLVAITEQLVQKRGGRVVTVEAPDGNGPADVLLKTILDAFSQYERAAIRSRTRLAMQAARAKNRRIGHLPYGKKLAADGIHLEENADEQQALGAIRLARAKGLTLHDICLELERLGHRNRKGERFRESHVAQLLDRHGNNGLL
jgi:DNA invertase Pin-like site-specific DNA recombinase